VGRVREIKVEDNQIVRFSEAAVVTEKNAWQFSESSSMDLSRAIAIL